MLKKTTSSLFFLIFFCFLSLTCVYAHDNITDELIAQDFKEPFLVDEPDGSFTDLAQDISDAGETLELTRDYKYNSSKDTVPNSGISIDKPLTINGNGHTIDASNEVSIFSVTSSNVVFKNINFINAKSSSHGVGCAVSTSGENTVFENCNFSGCDAYDMGSAIRSTASGLTINNCNFDSNQAVSAAVRIEGTNAKITNSNFTNNVALIGSGAISISNSDAQIDNCIFEGNYVPKNRLGDGGAIAINPNGKRTKITNSIFKSNYATAGGAININGASDVEITDSYFENNSAVKHGGAILSIASGLTVKNCEFANNTAVSGGGVYTTYSERYINMFSNSKIINSTFTNNYARYGGGGATVSSGIIEDSDFINNSAGNYGGAVDLTADSEISNSNFENNSAVFGGALYVSSLEYLQSWVVSSIFKNNQATQGNSIYVINKVGLSDNDVSSDDIYTFTESDGRIISRYHDIELMLQTDNGYYAYCSEKHNEAPYYGVYDHSMEKLLNSINHQPIYEYLKILIYRYIDHMDELIESDFHNYVWAFTDGEYWNSKDPVVLEVIRLYDNGFRVPTVNACKVLKNGTLMYFNFSSMITPSGQQNMFLFKFWYGDEINETFTKEALNKTAHIGDYVDYRIVVSNKGTSPVYDVWVEDKDYSKGLIYESWDCEVGDWSYDNLTKHWKLPVLNPGKSASIILKFKVVGSGKLYNNATSGVGNINVTNSTDDIYVYTPNFTVEKIALNKSIELGNQTEFEIVVRNIGEVVLTDLFVEEFSYDGLVYAGWYENERWTHSYVNGKHRWYLNDALAIDDEISFIVIFNTTSYGNFTNIVVAGSNQTDNKTGNNTTKVLKPDFVVKKNVLTPHVMVGNQTMFEIIVKNTGEVDLDDIVVIEDKYEGLVFDHAITGDLWVPTQVNGKHAWRLNAVLKPNAEEYFFVIFNTTAVGNFTNYVVATSNKTENKTGNNTTEVNKTVPEEYANFTVEKITIDKVVMLGELVEFQIVVKNTGNATIHNLTIYETEFEGLTYHSYVDHFDMWSFDKDGLSWRLNEDFYPGEELGIYVFFNTTRTGTFTNCVVVTSNETDNKTGNNTTRVSKPGIEIEKVAINKTVIVGEQVTFEIIVHNIGEEVLTDVIVRELDYESLVYDHFIDYSDFWSKNDDLSWTLNRPLAIGEYEGFYLVFNTTKRGNFTNYASVECNESVNDTDNDTVEVLDYNMTVVKNTITKKVLVGDNVEFEIIVRNTGDLVLKDVFVIESKYDSGLEYVRYYSVKGDWKYSYDSGKSLFKLDSLEVNESASFRVIFKATQIGNMSNSVEAGFNNTTVANSTNVTEIFNKTDDNKNRTGPSKHNETIEKNKTDSRKSEDTKKFKAQIDRKATGNPLIALILVLILLPIRRFIK